MMGHEILVPTILKLLLHKPSEPKVAPHPLAIHLLFQTYESIDALIRACGGGSAFGFDSIVDTSLGLGHCDSLTQTVGFEGSTRGAGVA